MWVKVSLAFCLALGAVHGFAKERAGELFIDEIMVQPTYSTVETEGGSFSFGSSSFSLVWEYEKRYRARVSIAGNSLRATPRIYDSADPTDEVDFYEAYGEYVGVYGRFRFGLLPLGFGYGGTQRESNLIFQRAFIYSNRVIALRDFGMSFYTENKGFYTEIVGHNGELDQSASDGQIWATARWGYTNERNMNIQVSAQAGRTNTTSTVSGDSGLAGYDATKGSLWRFASLFINWYPPRWNVLLQSTFGEREQDQEEGSFASNQLDFVHMFETFWGVGVRYETYDPDRDIEDDGFTSTGLVLVTGSQKSMSRFFFIATKKVEEGQDISSDEFRLVWRLTPYF